MKSKLTVAILHVFLGFLLTGCKKTNDAKEASNTTQLCFQNEYPFQDSSMKDVEELTLAIEGEKVTGAYNWLPAEKDQRKGSLTGTIKDNRITAQYRYLQEGTEGTAELIIIISDEKAEIAGGEPELGLNASIAKIDCDPY
jgi:hypothetical protein